MHTGVNLETKQQQQKTGRSFLIIIRSLKLCSHQHPTPPKDMPTSYSRGGHALLLMLPCFSWPHFGFSALLLSAAVSQTYKIITWRSSVSWKSIQSSPTVKWKGQIINLLHVHPTDSETAWAFGFYGNIHSFDLTACFPSTLRSTFQHSHTSGTALCWEVTPALL